MLPAENRAHLEDSSRHLMERMAEINREAARLQRQFFELLRGLNRDVAARGTAGVLSGLVERFHEFEQLNDWLDDLRRDVVEHYELLLVSEDGAVTARTDRAERRYSVNLLVDRSRETHPPVVCEHNPTYENLFGFLEFRPVP